MEIVSPEENDKTTAQDLRTQSTALQVVEPLKEVDKQGSLLYVSDLRDAPGCDTRRAKIC
jgi:hypothetical protein